MSVKSNPKSAFYIIALLIPILFIAGLEGLLRLANYGQTIPAFIPVENKPGFMQPNPSLIERYFPSAELAPDVSPDTVHFKAKKSADTFRIVIQGGSTAAGFPFGRFASLQGMLHQRLKNAYPDRDFEIINTAMAAVNTYTLIDIQDEIIALEPDLVLVYTGHNEYLGVLGAGSVMAGKGGHASTLLYLKMKSFRLFQLIESITFGLMTDANEGSITQGQDSRSTMAKAAAGQLIPYDGELFQQGLKQFEANLQTLLGQYQDAGIPVHIGNLVSIEKGLKPFSKGQAEQDAYQQGMELLANGQRTQAQEQLSKAKDLDQLRFRAPSQFNDVIELAASQHKAVLVDVETEFRQASQFGILDKSLLLEHVHPTAKGYFLLSEAFFEHTRKLLGAESDNPSQKTLTRQQAANWQPLTELDIRYGQEKIRTLMNGYPFTDQPKVLAPPVPKDAVGVLLLKRLKGESWLTIQTDLVNVYQQQNQPQRAANVAGVIADALVNSPQAHNSAAQLFRQSNQTRFAYYHQRQALQLVDERHEEYERYALNFAFDLFLAQKHQQSLALLKSLQPNSKQPKRVAFFINKVADALKQQTSSKRGK